MKKALSIPSGFEYFSLEKIKKFVEHKKKIENILTNHGFIELIPPLMDHKELFFISTSKRGLDFDTFLKEKNFETKDSNGDYLVVRPDITVIAMKSFIYQKEELSSIQYYYIQPVYRDYPKGSGFYREIYQIGVEWIGNFSNRINLLFNLLKELMNVFSCEYSVVFGNSIFLNRLLGYLPKEIHKEILTSFYFKDLEKIYKICKSFLISGDLKEILMEIPLLIGTSEIVKEYEILLRNYPDLLEIVKETVDSIKSEVMFDFSMVKEFAYYTGPIFEGYLNQNGKQIFSGGIYDSFSREFSNYDIPSCGFAINFTELLNI
ncbi:MAG: ATP phosphoribosyltransferase regulatory subunit [Leptonema sp. (in: bacteria)]